MNNRMPLQTATLLISEEKKKYFQNLNKKFQEISTISDPASCGRSKLVHSVFIHY